MIIRTNLLALQRHLPAGCKLIAVSKTQPPEKIMEVYNAGHRAFGENKVQELLPKFDSLPKDIDWHLIGHLQTNKVKYVVPFVHLIHAVDSARLLEEINKQASRINRTVDCLLQIHIASEETKFGFSQQEVLDLASSLPWEKLENIRITGLMGMATLTDNADQARMEFRGLKTFFDKLRSSKQPPRFNLSEISMGMSGDYKIAIEEGSTMIRVGTAIFGARDHQNNT